MIKVRLPLTPSLNQVRKMHWATYARLRDQYALLLRYHAHQRLDGTEFRNVTIDRYGSRALDHDNLVGGAKPLLDALKKVGLIVDDSPAHVRVHYNQHKAARRECRTVVTVTP